MHIQKKRLNWKRDLPDKRDWKFAAEPHIAAAAPPVVDLRPACISPVVNQGDIGSCTGNAWAGMLEALEIMEIKAKLDPSVAPEEFVKGVFAPISRLFIYYNERILEGDPSQDNGAQIRSGMLAVRQWGICRELVWSYLDAHALVKPSIAAYNEAASHKVLYGYKIDNTKMGLMKSCLMGGFPFVIGIAVYDSFLSNDVAVTGMVPMPNLQTESVQGGHALLVVGYDDNKHCFIVKNSWGTHWGDQGFCYIPYSYLTDADLAGDFWTARRVAVK